MLTLDQLRKHYSHTPNTSPKSILVEYLQCELLDSIFQQKGSEHLSFIGGTAIRIIYGGNRFSEDLDFDNFGLSFDNFLTLTKAVVQDMQRKGFEVEFRIIEKGAYHCYIKFPHILQDAKLSILPDEKILVRIDMMKKEMIFSPRTHILNKFDVYRTILVNPVSVLLSQKLLTIIGRKREKGRDFYDVSYLYGMTEPDFEYLDAVTGLSREDFARQLIERCNTVNFHDLAKDVEPFLIDPRQVERVIHFKEFISSKFEIPLVRR